MCWIWLSGSVFFKAGLGRGNLNFICRCWAILDWDGALTRLGLGLGLGPGLGLDLGLGLFLDLYLGLDSDLD